MPFSDPFLEEKKTVEQALNGWCKTMSCGTPDQIVALFHPDSLLLPTLAPDLLKTREEKLIYFQRLMSNPNLTVSVQESHIRIKGTLAIQSGLYTFSFDQADKKITLPARFTFIYEKTAEGWLIIEQHSSQMPTL